MTDRCEVTFFPETGRTRFANYRDGKLVGIYWKEDTGRKVGNRAIGKRATLDSRQSN